MAAPPESSALNAIAGVSPGRHSARRTADQQRVTEAGDSPPFDAQTAPAEHPTLLASPRSHRSTQARRAVGQALRDRLERHLGLDPRQRRSQSVVDAGPEKGQHVHRLVDPSYPYGRCRPYSWTTGTAGQRRFLTAAAPEPVTFIQLCPDK